MFPTTLTTERLRLRPIEAADADALFEEYGQDEEVTRFLRWSPHHARGEALAFLTEALTKQETEQHWAVCLPSDDRLVGMVTAWRRGRAVEIGYALARRLWGQGLMTEAARAVVAAIWTDPAIERIDAHAHVDNTASQRVLERCGLQRERVAKRAFKLPRFDEPQDAVLYAATRDDH